MSSRSLQCEEMERQVVETYATFKARYGGPRIAEELKTLNIPCSANYIADILKSRDRKQNEVALNYGNHALTKHNVSYHLLSRNFEASKPNEKWIADITYIWVEEQRLYLTTVMDFYSRSIVGWALDTTMTEQLVTGALSMAFERREVELGLVIHSDRGVQYRSQKYVDYMKSKGCKPSMSRKGNCWDNAPMESFFSRLKAELIYVEQYESISEAISDIFEYIEVFYNYLCRYSAIGYVSPAEFERIAADAA